MLDSLELVESEVFALATHLHYKDHNALGLLQRAVSSCKSLGQLSSASVHWDTLC
jgi:hypothetical protein